MRKKNGIIAVIMPGAQHESFINFQFVAKNFFEVKVAGKFILPFQVVVAVYAVVAAGL